MLYPVYLLLRIEITISPVIKTSYWLIMFGIIFKYICVLSYLTILSRVKIHIIFSFINVIKEVSIVNKKLESNILVYLIAQITPSFLYERSHNYDWSIRACLVDQ